MLIFESIARHNRGLSKKILRRIQDSQYFLINFGCLYYNLQPTYQDRGDEATNKFVQRTYIVFFLIKKSSSQG